LVGSTGIMHTTLIPAPFSHCDHLFRIVEAVGNSEGRLLFVESDVWSVKEMKATGSGMFRCEIAVIQNTAEKKIIPLGWVRSWIRAVTTSTNEAVFDKNPFER